MITLLLSFLATAGGADTGAASRPAIVERIETWPLLPRGVSSFGCATAGPWMYIFGGHVGRPHDHSKSNTSGDFLRLNLLDRETWESLSPGPAVQGTALVEAGGKLYRIGGMSASNASDEAENMHSTASVDVYDPVLGAWTPAPPLPEPRSSHDAAVVGRRIYVAGGWTLDGENKRWIRTAWSLDAEKPGEGWTAIAPPPTARRAAAMAALGDRIYRIGGMLEGGAVTRTVEVLDTQTGAWTPGPELPCDGFGIAAAATPGALTVSSRDGGVYQLHDGGREWERIGNVSIPRMFHRLAAHDGALLAVGGAGMDGDHLRVVEPLPDARDAAPSLAWWKIPFPGSARSRAGAFSAGDQWILFGGNTSPEPAAIDADHLTREAWRLRLGSLHFERLADFPFDGQSFQTVPGASRRKSSFDLLALGGLGLRDGRIESLDSVVGFDAESGGWTQHDEKLPHPMTQFGTAESGDRLFLLGGLHYDSTRASLSTGASKSVVAASREGAKLQFSGDVAELPSARRAFACAAYGEKIFLLGGMREGFEPKLILDVFDVKTRAVEARDFDLPARLSPETALLGDAWIVAGGGAAPPARDRAPEPRDRSVMSIHLPTGRTEVLWRALPFPTEMLRLSVHGDRIAIFAVDPREPHTAYVGWLTPPRTPVER